MFESLASCFAFRCSASLDMTASLMRRVLIERVDEIRHFYQFTVVTQSSYSLLQPRSKKPTQLTNGIPDCSTDRSCDRDSRSAVRRARQSKQSKTRR